MNKIKRFLKMFLYSFVSKRTLITIIILLLLLLLKNNVMAFELDNQEFPDLPFNTEDFPYYVIYYNRANASSPYLWRIFACAYEFYTPNTSQISVGSGSTNEISIYVLENNTWVSSGTTGFLSSGAVNRNGLKYSSFDFRTSPNGTIIRPADEPIEPTPPEPIEPYFIDNLLDLTNLSGTEITIDSGNQELVDDEIIFKLSTRPKGSPIGDTVYTTILSPSSEFYNANGVNGAYYEIPIEIFKDFLTSGYELTYYLEWRLTETPAQRDNSEITVVYNPQAETVDDIELLNANLNSNFNKLNNTIINNFNNLSQQQQEAIDTAKDTNQFLKNDNFDNGNLNLPTSQGEDITQDGINNIFTIIYNAFTSGQAPDIIVPIPFTGKSFTIEANFLRNILNGTQFSFISNIIELFWWYIISIFIVKDIAKKMNKIKSGDLENLENSNIKEEML